MKILILGGGLIGVTTAYALMKDGHEVTVVERNAGVAEETSFANASLIACGHTYPWASPKVPGILLKSLWRDDLAFKFRFSADPDFWLWSAKFLGQCTAARAARNTRLKHRLCRYSQAVFHTVKRDSQLVFDGLEKGLLYLYRSERGFAEAQAHMGLLVEGEQELEPISPAEATAIDPGLAGIQDQLAGAVYAPTDESGDARLFTQGLAMLCQDSGVDFRYQTTIAGLSVDGEEVTAVETSEGRLQADAYVLALGPYSARLAKPLGVKLPIYPVKGYSVTVPVEEHHRPPALGGVDEDNLMAYCPLGNRLRLTAKAEFAGFDSSHRPSDFTRLLAIAQDLFPDGGDYQRPSYWACLRPMTPRGLPIFGTGRQRNLYYNVGHGHMGWTMCAGSAQITADLIAGRKPDIDLTGLTLP